MIVLSGASASGKTEVAKVLASKYGIGKMITTTTRPMRVGEVDGKDYFFVTKEQFESMLKRDKFVEHTIYNGNYYGSGRDQIGDNKCVVIDAAGLRSYSALKNEKFIVTFFLNASEETRLERMKGRGDRPQDIERRIINDRDAFDIANVVKVNYNIDSEFGNVEEIADYIYSLYKKELENHYSNK